VDRSLGLAYNKVIMCSHLSLAEHWLLWQGGCGLAESNGREDWESGAWRKWVKWKWRTPVSCFSD